MAAPVVESKFDPKDMVVSDASLHNKQSSLMFPSDLPSFRTNWTEGVSLLPWRLVDIRRYPEGQYCQGNHSPIMVLQFEHSELMSKRTASKLPGTMAATSSTPLKFMPMVHLKSRWAKPSRSSTGLVTNMSSQPKSFSVLVVRSPTLVASAGSTLSRVSNPPSSACSSLTPTLFVNSS